MHIIWAKREARYFAHSVEVVEYRFFSAKYAVMSGIRSDTYMTSKLGKGVGPIAEKLHDSDSDKGGV